MAAVALIAPYDMSTVSESNLGDAPEVIASAEDDWDRVKANVKQLVKALHSLTPQPSELVESKVSPILGQISKITDSART
jgi:hypothetical protein